MKLVKIVIGIAIGAVLATVLAWLGLYLFGAFVVRGNGSLFDASRTAENTFFVIWFALIVIVSVVGGYVGYANGAKRKEN